MSPERAQELLDQARAHAEAELARIDATAQTGEPDSDDASAGAEDLIERETDEALQELLTRRLEAIAQAQERLRDGTYGRSVRSGDTIPDARLEIEPWAELTVEEQATP